MAIVQNFVDIGAAVNEVMGRLARLEDNMLNWEIKHADCAPNKCEFVDKELFNSYLKWATTYAPKLANEMPTPPQILKGDRLVYASGEEAIAKIDSGNIYDNDNVKEIWRLVGGHKDRHETEYATYKCMWSRKP